MSQKKIKIKSNPGPGLSEALANSDYEIQPVMIEVWDGKRIAWAIAILIALILIPVAALLIDSYRKDSRIDTDQSVTGAESAENVLLAVNESEIEPRSAVQSPGSPSLDLSQQSVEVEGNKDTAVAASTADTEVRADEPRIESEFQLTTDTGNSSVVTNVGSEKPSQQPALQPELSDKAAKTITRAENDSTTMKLADLVKPDKQQVKQVQISQPTTETVNQGQAIAEKTVSDELARIPSQSDSTQPGIASSQVSRSRLVKSIDNREPVGNEVDVINLSGGNAVRLYYFTELNGMAGQTITYRWLYEGNLIYSKPVVIKGNYTWRSYIGKLIPASMSGNWMVEIVDSENRQLASKSFQAL